MFDTMTLVKTVGAACGALLIFMLGGWFSQTIYGGGGHHGEGDHAQGYVIEVADAGGAAEAEAEVPFADLVAAADLGKGEKLFRKCSACHALEAGVVKAGPSLHGIIDRAVGAEPGFNYSGALKAVAETWSPDNLNGFLEKPGSYAPGTSMGFSGLKKPQERADLVAYLQSLQ